MIFPFLILANFENSVIAIFLNNNMYLLFLIVLVFIYIIITGVYYSYFRIDSYIINASSSRFSSKNNLLDIRHDMLEKFHFKKSFFSWNTVLYLNFKKTNKNSVMKKFYFSLLAESNKNKISLILNKIISNN
jgi:hypothetical protein